MKRILLLSMVFLCGFIGLSSAEGTKPIQIGIFNPIQIFPSDDSIAGLRLSIPYSKNNDTTGLSLGVWNQTTGDSKGVDLDIVSLDDGSFRGVQIGGVVHVVSGSFI